MDHARGGLPSVKDESIALGGASLKRDMLAAFEGLRPPSSFAGFEELQRQPPMGLSICGYGDVLVPLDDDEAEALLAVMHPSSHPQHSDPSAVDTWELDGCQLVFHNPDWPEFLSSACRTSSRILGVQGNIHAKLDKLVICGPGAQIDEHIDKPFVPGAFGSLVISLPSRHTGGKMTVKHDGQSIIINPQPCLQSLACWYSDVSFQLSPIISGYSWMLRYDLVAESEEVPRPLRIPNEVPKQNLRATVERWLAEDPQSRSFDTCFYLLNQSFCSRHISQDALFPDASSQVTALRDAVVGLPVDIFLAQIQRVEIGSCLYSADDFDFTSDYEDDDEVPLFTLTTLTKKTYCVQDLAAINGDVIMTQLRLSEGEVLNPSLFEGELAGEETYWEEGAQPTAEQRYYKIALALVPHGALYPMLRSNEASSLGIPFHRVFPELRAIRPQPFVNENRIMALEALCEPLWDGSLSGADVDALFDFVKLDYGNLLRLLLVHKRIAAFKRLAVHHRGHLDLPFFGWLGEWLELLDQSDNWVDDWIFDQTDETSDSEEDTDTESLEDVKVATNPGTPLDSANEQEVLFLDLQDTLKSMLRIYSTFSDRIEAIAVFLPLKKPSNASNCRLSTVLCWVRDTLKTITEEAFCYPAQLKSQKLVVCSVYFENPCEYLSQWASNWIVDKTADVIARLELLNEIHTPTADIRLPKKERRLLFRSLAESFIESVDFVQIQIPDDADFSEEEEESDEEDYEPKCKGAFGTRNIIGNFLGAVIDMSKAEPALMDLLLTKFINDAPRFQGWQLVHLWMPILIWSIRHLKSARIPLNRKVFKDFSATIIAQFLDRYVGQEPSINPPSSHPWPSCNSYNGICDNCDKINNFLNYDKAKIGQFDVPTKTVEHETYPTPNSWDGEESDSEPLVSVEHGVEHLTEQLNEPHMNCLYKVTQNDKSSTLTLTIMKVAVREEKEHQEWENRRRTAAYYFENFERGSLKTLLGPGYKKIVAMDHLKAGAEPEGVSLGTRLPKKSRPLDTPAKGYARKRKCV